MDVVEKQIVHEYDENHKEYASKGVAGTSLGLGIAKQSYDGFNKALSI